MQKGLLPKLLLLSAVSLTVFQSCKKESALGIDNNKVVKTPYSLYAANEQGWLITTTDGEQYRSIFPPDGYEVHSILTSGNNLLMLKQNLHLSSNEGKNFNPVYTQVKHFPWKSMIYDFPAHNAIYITSYQHKGVAVSKDQGKTWMADSAFAQGIPTNFEISSFAGLASNKIFAFSNLNNVLYCKQNEGAEWTPVTMQGLFPVDGTEFYLSSNNTFLYLTDYNGIGGVWYSEDEGQHWTKFGQGALPKNHKWLSANSVNQGQAFVVGTDSFGLYRIENHSFVSANVGLEPYTSVYSISEKRNVYKNDAVKNYLFMGNNYGIYRSEDGGATWDKMTFAEWNGKYTATY